MGYRAGAVARERNRPPSGHDEGRTHLLSIVGPLPPSLPDPCVEAEAAACYVDLRHRGWCFVRINQQGHSLRPDVTSDSAVWQLVHERAATDGLDLEPGLFHDIAWELWVRR